MIIIDKTDLGKIIKETVHSEYYDRDANCATTSLICLGKLLDFEPCDQLMCASIGMHGAGGYRAQCGLVEGGLMAIGIIGSQRGLSKERIIKLCYVFAKSFEHQFGSLRCRELRPNGFTKDDPPHLCESLTIEACRFSYDFSFKYILAMK